MRMAAQLHRLANHILAEARGEGNSIVFHLSFLTHSACQYDVI